MGWNASLWYQFDAQTWLGVTSGRESVKSSEGTVALGSAMMRLPIGRVILPVMHFDAGMAFADTLGGFTWKGGGGLDIKNGKRSSILLLSGYNYRAGIKGWYTRAGLLLEF